MSDEAGQKAMLYFIEVLMNTGEPVNIAQLASRFYSKSFTPDMVQAAGQDTEGLKVFLAKYTSLFIVDGDYVTINNHGVTIPTMTDTIPYSKANVEEGARKYFEDHLIKKGGKVLIKSLAGHLSQAPQGVRNCVGPQIEFRRFLKQHSGTFIIDGDMVSIADSKMCNIQPEVKQPTSIEPTRTAKPAPVSMTASEYKAMKFVKDIVEKSENATILMDELVKCSADAPVAAKNIFGEKGEHLEEFIAQFGSIFTLTTGSTEPSKKSVSVRKTRLNVVMVGSRPMTARSNSFKENHAKGDEGQSLRKSYSKDEALPPSRSSTSDDAANGKPTEKPTSLSQQRTVNNSCGPVYHLAKLWGILDLGKHEHVFFDRSILPDNYDDLTKQFRIGENLRFNAVRAARGSRARWRATHVWRDGQDIRSMYGDNSRFSLAPLCSEKFEEEVKQLLPTSESDKRRSAYSSTSSEEGESSVKSSSYIDAPPSSTGYVPVWKQGVPRGQAGDSVETPCLTFIAEASLIKNNVMKDARYIPGYVAVPLPNANDVKNTHTACICHNGDVPKFKDASCQTISTGDILATQLYDDTS